MARTRRSDKLGSKDQRARIPLGHREWFAIGRGLALAYRRTESGDGTWQARAWREKAYVYRNLGRADDHQDANGVDVLSFGQAQKKAHGFYAVRDEVADGTALEEAGKPVTVRRAAEHYLAWYRVNRRGLGETEAVLNAHILPEFGDRLVADLTTRAIRAWHQHLAEQPARVRSKKTATKPRFRDAPGTEDEKRARKATANRDLTILKAMLNKAVEDGLVSNGRPWAKVKPFKKVEHARLRFLSDDEAVRLVNACQPDLRALVHGALLTGCRFGELARLHVRDVNLSTGHVFIAESKSGEARNIPLNSEGLALFRALLTGKTGDALVLTKADGKPWGRNHHIRPLLLACKAAKVRPAVSFHELRHTYASHLAQAGVPIFTIAKLLGHASTRITERHYAHLADKTLAAAVEKLPSFGILKAPKLVAVPGESSHTVAAPRK